MMTTDPIAPPSTEAELRSMMKLHRACTHETCTDHCQGCGTRIAWPCPTARLLALVERLGRRADLLLGALNSFGEHGETCTAPALCTCGLEDALACGWSSNDDY